MATKLPISEIRNLTTAELYELIAILDRRNDG